MIKFVFCSQTKQICRGDVKYGAISLVAAGLPTLGILNCRSQSSLVEETGELLLCPSWIALGQLFSTKKESCSSNGVNSSLGKRFRYDWRLDEFDTESKVYDRMNCA